MKCSAAYAAGPHVRLSWAPGQGHRRIIADPQVVGEIVRFAAPGPRLTAPFLAQAGLSASQQVIAWVLAIFLRFQ